MKPVSPIAISGGGPAGLVAAITIARSGGQTEVFESRASIGARFHGDFQGLENWSMEQDVIEELSMMGIKPTFNHTPFRECVFFGPDGRESVCRSTEPLWYLVTRGNSVGTLDRALEEQALAAGVSITRGHTVRQLPHGGIVAHGPKRADAIAVGYVFDTDMADGAFAAVSDYLAPEGYAYFLVCGGRATVASCMFSDFHNEKLYLERTVDYFRTFAGLSMRNETRFGGLGNMSAMPMFRRMQLLFAGEAAGLQDALFGFGMRMAMTSGHLAGKAFASGQLDAYETTSHQRLLPLVRAATVNRYLYGRAGHIGYRALVNRVCSARDPRGWLRRAYSERWWTPLLYPVARAAAERGHRHVTQHACKEECSCTWCRCTRDEGKRDS